MSQHGVSSERFSIRPSGPFRLSVARDHFDRWPLLSPTDDRTLVVAFPVEGWATSAAVVLRQEDDGLVSGEVHGAGAHAGTAWRQVLTALSLDVDGAGFPSVGERDPVVGAIQAELGWLRPICATSPYEAAVARVLGQRSSIAQQHRTRAALAQATGDRVSVGDRIFPALPRPARLCELPRFPGISDEKLARLQAVARAADAGLLATERLRALPYARALAELRAIPGVGEWTSQGTLLRGAGIVDEVPDDEMTQRVVERAYALRARPTHDEVLRIADAWRPYRMWTVVLLHVWARRSGGLTPRGRSRAPRATRGARA